MSEDSDDSDRSDDELFKGDEGENQELDAGPLPMEICIRNFLLNLQGHLRKG